MCSLSRLQAEAKRGSGCAYRGTLGAAAKAQIYALAQKQSACQNGHGLLSRVRTTCSARCTRAVLSRYSM